MTVPLLAMWHRPANLEIGVIGEFDRGSTLLCVVGAIGGAARIARGVFTAG
jgi:hypothetical protein